MTPRFRRGIVLIALAVILLAAWWDSWLVSADSRAADSTPV